MSRQVSVNGKHFSDNHSFVRTDLFKTTCDHIFWSDDDPKENLCFQAGDVVFCKIDHVLKLFEYLRLTRKRIILVTGEGDYPCDSFRQQFLPTNVVRWFATNVIDPHPLVTPIPLGLGDKKGTWTVTFSEDDYLAGATFPKTKWLYVNFRPETNRSIRQKIYDAFKKRAEQETWIIFDPPFQHGDNEVFVKQLKEHRFVLTPPGNGIDTHRLWEALIVGSYPIALRSSVLEAFEELPILFVDDYNEVTLDFLQVNLEQLEKKRANNFMLRINYWEQKIQEAKKILSHEKNTPWSEWIKESFLYGQKMMKRRFLRHVSKNKKLFSIA